MTDIRKSTQQHLTESGCKQVTLFLIDSYKLKKFEFEQLEYRLVEELPELKKTALILSLQATSEDMIRLKVVELRSRIWKVAAFSSAVAVTQLPGVSVPFDFSLVVEKAEFYYKQLGLDETSLKRYAKLTSSDYQQVRSVVDRRLVCKVIGVEEIMKLVEELARDAPSLAAPAAMDEVCKFIPVVGSVITASLSVGGTYYALKLMLEKMESVALEIVTRASKPADC